MRGWTTTGHSLIVNVVQLSLPLSIPPRPLTKEEAVAKRKHELIVGRPRRLEPGSKVIKVGIPQKMVRQIDRVRGMMIATRPDFIRTALEDYVASHPSGEGVPSLEKPVARKPGHRAAYWKVPFPPTVLRWLQETSTLTGNTRQQLINLAIESLVAQYL